MQEEVERKTVALVFKAAKFGGDELSNAMRFALSQGLQNLSKDEIKKGEMSIADLVGKGNGLKSFEVNSESVNLFRQVAKDFNVDFAVRTDRTGDIPKHMVFFQAKDNKVIAQCFKEYVNLNEKEKLKKSAREEIKKNKEKIKDKETKEKAKEKVRSRSKEMMK